VWDACRDAARRAHLETRLRRELGEQAEDAVHLEAALDRAVRAVRDLRRDDAT
jgi:hypothetical protein